MAASRRPVIMTVDDEPEVLNAVERDLRSHFRSDYMVVKANSGRQALDTVNQLKEREASVALFLVDERMPEMSGTEFLAEALKVYPDARKVLLTAYADTQAAISGINDVGLDYYLMKPWDPPEERLFPVLDDVLQDWIAGFRPPFRGIKVAGSFLVAGQSRREGLPLPQSDPVQVARRGSRPRGSRARRDEDERRRRAAGRRIRGPLLPGRAHAPGAGGPCGHADPGHPALLRPHRGRWRAGRARGGRLRGLGGSPHRARRSGRHRRTGRHELQDRELPRLPEWARRCRPGTEGHDSGQAVRGGGRRPPRRHVGTCRGPLPDHHACRTEPS